MSVQRVGIIGGGQLAQMLARSVKHLGVECAVLDPSTECCARSECEQIVGAYDDVESLKELARWSDVVTYEFENVSASAAVIEGEKEIYPSTVALGIADRKSVV